MVGMLWNEKKTIFLVATICLLILSLLYYKTYDVRRETMIAFSIHSSDLLKGVYPDGRVFSLDDMVSQEIQKQAKCLPPDFSGTFEVARKGAMGHFLMRMRENKTPYIFPEQLPGKILLELIDLFEKFLTVNYITPNLIPDFPHKPDQGTYEPPLLIQIYQRYVDALDSKLNELKIEGVEEANSGLKRDFIQLQNALTDLRVVVLPKLRAQMDLYGFVREPEVYEAELLRQMSDIEQQVFYYSKISSKAYDLLRLSSPKESVANRPLQQNEKSMRPDTNKHLATICMEAGKIAAKAEWNLSIVKRNLEYLRAEKQNKYGKIEEERFEIELNDFREKLVVLVRQTNDLGCRLFEKKHVINIVRQPETRVVYRFHPGWFFMAALILSFLAGICYVMLFRLHENSKDIYVQKS